MASNSHVVFVFVFSVFILITTPAFSTSLSCKSVKLSAKTAFDNCIDLPTLSAVLHYTYDPTKSTLSTAFTAPTSVPNGWVAWALNPKALGMAGAQSLIAFKPKESSPITVNTYDIVSYGSINKGPISYNVTGLSTEESKGVITIYATWVIPRGESSVNAVWQVGPVTDGQLGPHDFNPDNLLSTMELKLAGKATAVSPAGAPAIYAATFVGAPVEAFDKGAPAEAPVKQSGGAMGSVVSVTMVLGALLVCLL